MGIYQAGNTKNPDSMVILLHGYGANGQDLLGLGEHWAPHFPGTVFVSPDAPHSCEMSPFGYQWFSLGDWSPMSMAAGARSVAPWLNDFIDAQLIQYKVEPDRLVLAGFSQGTMMALYVALRRAQKIAGVLGYSGALLCADEWKQIKLQKPEICLVHGVADTTVPVAAYFHAAQMLQQHDFPFEGHVLPSLMHGINDYGLDIGQKFLKRILFGDAI
jgi:phospholipase/carboxylesterase